MRDGGVLVGQLALAGFDRIEQVDGDIGHFHLILLHPGGEYKDSINPTESATADAVRGIPRRPIEGQNLAAALAPKSRARAALEANTHSAWRAHTDKEAKRTPLRSAPGLSGLRIEHVVAASRNCQLGPLVRDLRALVIDLLLDNSVAFPALARSVLSPVVKPKGGIRPIGVGEITRRDAARIAADAAFRAFAKTRSPAAT